MIKNTKKIFSGKFFYSDFRMYRYVYDYIGICIWQK